MSERPRSELALDDLSSHPAVVAWRRLGPAHLPPTRIESVRESKKSSTYCLDGVGVGGANVIAKRCLAATASIERTVYETLLPRLPVTALHYYGFVEDEARAWLFLADAGSVRFLPRVASQRRLVSIWLARMHASAESMSASADLPARAGAHYLDHLRTARQRIRACLDNPALSARDVTVLHSVTAQCDAVERRWSELEDHGAGAPVTLVHGDFRPKNVHLRADESATRVFVLDWETAGLGAPAVDLAPPRGVSPDQHLDLRAYWSVARERWPTLSFEAVRRLATVGTIFRRLAAMDWASLELGSPHVERAVARLEIYRDEAATAMQAVTSTG